MWVIVVLLLPVLLEYAASSPVRDYIIAYIPIEEYEQLVNIDAVPSTSYQLVFPGDYESGPIVVVDETYYPLSCNSVGVPLVLNQGIPVYTISTLPIYQHISIPTISVLPTVSLPTITISSPTYPTATITIPSLPVTYVKYTTTSTTTESPVEEVVSPEAVPVTTAPISGSVAFNGMVPASGKIKIFAHY